MRFAIILFALMTAALLGAIQRTMAQSPYSYPWCATYSWPPATACYFTSWEQCMTTISGLGGICYRSPYFHSPAAVGAPRAATSRRRPG